jgi:hypothetical protein
MMKAGIAMTMAILQGRIVHGPIEALFTVDEPASVL